MDVGLLPTPGSWQGRGARHSHPVRRTGASHAHVTPTRARCLPPGGLAAAPLTTAGTATGALLDSGTDTFTIAETIKDYCDVKGLRVQHEASVVVRWRDATHGSDGLVYFTEQVDYAGTITNPRTGRWVTDVVNTLTKDLHVTDNGDGTLTIVVFGTGNAAVYDESGAVLGRDPGQTRWQITVDHGGTPDDPSDDEFLSFDGVLLGSTGRSDDYCTAVLPVLG